MRERAEAFIHLVRAFCGGDPVTRVSERGDRVGDRVVEASVEGAKLVDGDGRLLLRGRERDEINKGGMKIYPSDIDAVVERFERAKDVCTFALDDPIYGQAVGMAIVLADKQDETIRALHAQMRLQLAEHKMPSRWWLLDDIPRTSRGKLNRDAVKAACQKQPALDLPSILSPGRRA